MWTSYDIAVFQNINNCVSTRQLVVVQRDEGGGGLPIGKNTHINVSVWKDYQETLSKFSVTSGCDYIYIPGICYRHKPQPLPYA